jgi:hypothetical protein
MKILITESQYKKLKKHIKNQERLDEVNWSELKRSGRNLAASAVIAGSSLLGSHEAKGQSIGNTQNKTKSNLEYLNKFSHLNKANQPLKFFKSPKTGNRVMPIGKELRYGIIKIIYDFSLGDLKFSSTNTIDKIKKVNDGYQLFSDTGQVTLTAYKDNQIVATLKTYMNAKDYQEYILSQNNEFKTIKLIKQATPRGQFNIPSGMGLIIVKSNTDNLVFDSSVENLEGITYKNGFYYVPVSTGPSSIKVTTKDNSAIVLNNLNFDQYLVDETEPRIEEGDVYYYVAQ